MGSLDAFPITHRWPARHPDRIQLYSLNTPNGVKASIMLEETGLPYEAHLVDFASDEQKSPEFLSLNPNGKIPAMIDSDGPGGRPLALFESGAILLYLADKTGKCVPFDPAERWHAIQWVMFQMGGVGPMFGQLGFFNKFAGKAYEDKGKVLAVDPPEHLSVTHWSPLSGLADEPQNYHTVSYDLAPTSGGTRVTLTQENLIGVSAEQSKQNWRPVLDGLKQTVEAA